MDCQCLEVLLGLPACRVSHQVLSPQQLEWQLERRDSHIVCPPCGPGCSHVKERRPRCLRDLPILERPVRRWRHLRRCACPACRPRPWETSATCGERTQWTQRLYQQGRAECLRGCPCNALARRYGRSARTVLRWPVARSRGGRPRKLGRALGLDAYARRKGHRYHTLRVDWDSGHPIAPCKGRQAEDGIAWFTSRPPAARALVKVVVLDMAKTFFSAISLPYTFISHFEMHT